MYVYSTAYMNITVINGKRGHTCQRKQGVEYARVLTMERERGNDVIILKFQEIKEIIRTKNKSHKILIL